MRLLATLFRIESRWFVTISGLGLPFTKESGFSTSDDAEAWARTFAKQCGFGLDTVIKRKR